MGRVHVAPLGLGVVRCGAYYKHVVPTGLGRAARGIAPQSAAGAISRNPNVQNKGEMLRCGPNPLRYLLATRAWVLEVKRLRGL